MSALIQQTKEWHEFRKDKIGASDAPIIMQVSPWTTPYQLWEEKLSINTQDEKDKNNQYMQRGLALECVARERFSEETGLLVAPDVIVHPNRPWMMASLDAIDIERKHIAELKCPGKEDHEMAKNGKIPEKYYPQLQHQIEVSQLDMAYYVSFDGEDAIILNVYRNDEYIKNLVDKEEKFLDCVKNLIPPDLTDRDYNVKDDDIWLLTASEWLCVSKELSKLEKREQELREKLIFMCQNQNSKGAGLKISRYMRKGNVEYSKIPEIQSVNLEQYRKAASECWKISKE